MKPGWTAGVTRGRLLLSRTLGAEQAHAVAARTSLGAAISAIAGSAYGERVHSRSDVVAAQRGIADTLLWHLRILAGWLPPGGVALVRALAAWFEIQNIDARLAALAGEGREPPPYALGALATAWSRLERARTVDELATAIVDSGWGDPGGRSAVELALGLRVLWARRVHEVAPAAAGELVAGAGALLVAREQFVAGSHQRDAQLRRLPGIGEQPLRANSIDELRGELHPQAAWALESVSEPGELWRAELGWWSRAEHDAVALLRRWSGEEVVLATVALLALDAQRVARALAAAANGGDPELVELVSGVR